MERGKKEGGREGWMDGGRDGWRERGREGWRERGKEGGRERDGGKEEVGREGKIKGVIPCSLAITKLKAPHYMLHF